ncbi:cellulose synthase/poly-beta-1,6-N-acetylglucosamine synthase-like glycosyltransferase [Lewinella aquimaris]|uniref:Cellulose synthase/poly-beta-1,6-N-acetylglucosamine synthase-like glycosyltransferase n=1 Tax=Neolewinella aquimaris TaxID=1835722 RepID=A0A840E7C3_9BACT|nr:glycosyltransferase [Neolewinella aquimaris]MBB4079843.1 cellulose synthase/poly-beta-1,6-N-acetylglucosamine synthase-like glycosyltransferase [Neolewinella aquimaris]
MRWLAAGPLVLSTLYLLWQCYNYQHWLGTLARKLIPTAKLPTVAVVVPFRNEAAHLPQLVADLLAQDYPADRYELILVDDFSTDGGAAGAVKFGERARLIRLADFPPPPGTVAFKKAALTLGISRTTAEVIVTTDADCRWPPRALRRVAEAFSGGADVVLGPVLITPSTGLCANFQALDLAGFQLFTAATATAGTPALANGAHFAFRRDSFYGVGGYAGVDHLPSGDDVLLLHKFAAEENLRIVYSAEVDGLVTTAPVADWRAVWRQRIRWAGKAGNYQSPALSVAQVLAFLTSAGILGALVLGIIYPVFLVSGLLAWGIKGVIDYILLRSVCRHFGHGNALRWYLPVQLIYPLYLVGVGTAVLLGAKAGWKGRRAT